MRERERERERDRSGVGSGNVGPVARPASSGERDSKREGETEREKESVCV